jgi:NAD-dependent DNA ligase
MLCDSLFKQFFYTFLGFEDIEIRGKVYIKHSVFNSLKKLGNQFVNPRNAASVSLRQLDAKITSFVI